MLLTALILICSLATISNDCTRDNALDVVYVPATFDSPAACMMRAQVYVANSSIGRDLPQNEAFKVICVRESTESTKPRAAQGAGRANLAAPFRVTVQRRATTVRLVRQRYGSISSLSGGGVWRSCYGCSRCNSIISNADGLLTAAFTTSTGDRVQRGEKCSGHG